MSDLDENGDWGVGESVARVLRPVAAGKGTKPRLLGGPFGHSGHHPLR